MYSDIFFCFLFYLSLISLDSIFTCYVYLGIQFYFHHIHYQIIIENISLFTFDLWCYNSVFIIYHISISHLYMVFPWVLCCSIDLFVHLFLYLYQLILLLCVGQVVYHGFWAALKFLLNMPNCKAYLTPTVSSFCSCSHRQSSRSSYHSMTTSHSDGGEEEKKGRDCLVCYLLQKVL